MQLESIKNKHMIKLIAGHFWKAHQDGILSIVSGVGAVLFSLSNVDLILRILVSTMTLFYIVLKIHKFLKGKK